MKIATLDRTALKNLRDPIEAELKALGERLGLSLTLGSGTYGDGAEASFKLILKVDDPAIKAAAAKAIWNRNCQMIGYDFSTGEGGLRPEDFGAEFLYGGAKFRATGIAIKGKGSQKFPIIVEVLDGGPKRYEVGKTLMLPESAAKIIRAATDAAKGKVAVAA